MFLSALALVGALHLAPTVDQPGCVSADTGTGDATVQYCDQYRLESDDAIDPVADCLTELGYHGRSDDGKAVIYSTWQDIEWCAAQTERATV